VSLSDREFETREEDGQKVIKGYFAVFNQSTELYPGVTEHISPGAFAGATDVRGLINHDTSKVLGRTKAGTLKLVEDSYGLFGTIIVNSDDPDAVGMYARIQRGDVDQASFGGYIVSENFKDLGNKKYDFEILEFDLWEISPCTFPQYEQTGLSTRTRTISDHEDQLRREALKKRLLRGKLGCQKD